MYLGEEKEMEGKKRRKRGGERGGGSDCVV